MTKKILAVLLALAMIFSLCAVEVSAADDAMKEIFSKTVTVTAGDNGWYNAVIFGKGSEDLSDFMDAIKETGSRVTVTFPFEGSTWLQLYWQKASGGYQANNIQCGGWGNTIPCTGAELYDLLDIGYSGKDWQGNEVVPVRPFEEDDVNLVINFGSGDVDVSDAKGTTMELKVSVSVPNVTIPDDLEDDIPEIDMTGYEDYTVVGEGSRGVYFVPEDANNLDLFTIPKANYGLEEDDIIIVAITPYEGKDKANAIDPSEIGVGVVATNTTQYWSDWVYIGDAGDHVVKTTVKDVIAANSKSVSYDILNEIQIALRGDLKTNDFICGVSYKILRAPKEDEDDPTEPELPEGYEIVKTFTGEKTEVEEGGNIFTIVQGTDFTFESDDYIYYTITPSADVEEYQAAVQVQNMDWGSDWSGMSAGSKGTTVSFYFKELLEKNPTVPLEELRQVLVQVWDAGGETIDDYTFIIARKPKADEDDDDEEDSGLSVVKLIDNGITAHGVDLSKGGAVAWGTVIIDDTDDLWDEYVTALKTNGAKFTVKYNVKTTANWMNWFQGKIGDTVGHAGGLPTHTDTNSGGDLAVGTHIVTFTAEDYIDLFTNHSCVPDEWNTFEHSAGDITIDDSKGMYLQSDGALDITFSDFYIVYDPTAGSIDDCKHDGELSYENNADGTHKVVCAKCKKILKAAEECTYGSDGKCTKCGGEKLDPSAVKLPEGYEIVKTYTGGKTKFSSSDGTLFTIPQSEMNFEANDYIYFHITPSEGTENYQAAVQVQNNEWGSDWQGMGAGKNGDTVQFYFSELLEKNPTVPLAKLQQVLVQVWDVNVGDSLDGYTFIVARMPKEEKPALPDDYIETAAIDIPEDTTLDGSLIEIVPTEEVSTSSLLVSFAEKTPCSGTIDVYFDETEYETITTPLTVEYAENGGKNVGGGTIFGYAKLPNNINAGDTITVNVEGTTTVSELPYRMYLVDPYKNDNCISNKGSATIIDVKDGKASGSYELTADSTAGYIQFKTGYGGSGNADLTIDSVSISVTAPKGSTKTRAAAAEGEVRKVSQTFDKGTWVAYVSLGEYSKEAIKKIVITADDDTKTLKVDKVLIMDPSKEPNAKKVGKTFAYAIQLSDTMHGYLVKGRMLPMPHTFVNDTCSGCGFKKKVSIAVETEKDDEEEAEEAKEETKKETSTKPYYTMTKTTGQNFENNISSKTGVELEINDGMTRLATDWVNRDAWDQLFKAMKDHKDGNIVLTYTGTITEIGVEHDNGGAKERDKVEITDVAEVNGKNVYTIAVADFLPVIEEALEDESWKNFYVIPDEKDGAVLYGFQIARPAADDAEEDAEEEVELPDPYVFPLEADTKLDGWITLVNYENEAWGSDELWTALWGDSKIEIEYTGDGEPQLIAQYGGAKGYGASISPESVKDTDDGTHIATYSGEKFREALVRDANKRGFRQDDENDPYAFFAIVIDGNIWGDDGKVVETLVYKSGRIIPSSDPAKDPEYTDFYTIKPGTELSEWTPLVWYEGSDDITEIFNEIMWLDGAKIEINYTGDALLLIAQYSDNDGNSAYSSVPEPDEIIENEDGSKTAVYDCANYIKAVRADAKQYNFDPYETVEWVFDNGHVYGYTLDGRFWDEEGNQTNSIFNWAKISAPAANN